MDFGGIEEESTDALRGLNTPIQNDEVTIIINNDTVLTQYLFNG